MSHQKGVATLSTEVTHAQRISQRGMRDHDPPNDPSAPTFEHPPVTAYLDAGDHLSVLTDQIPKEGDLARPRQGFEWAKNMTLTQIEAEMLADPTWAVENVVISGHMTVFVAPPGAGKTTIVFWLAKQMVAKGLDVYYVNADISATDAKAYVMEAEKAGICLMLPDMKVGLSIDDVIANLTDMNRDGGDFSNVVFVIDTLKKLVDVINKSRAKEIYKLLRGLTAKGMTIIVNAHTNKHPGPDGKLIYEGTGDLRADFDNLIYLVAQKHDDGSMIVSTEPDKTRGAFEKVSFEISKDRHVRLLDTYHDIKTEQRAEQQFEDDLPIIDAIEAAIAAGECIQGEITEFCKNNGMVGRDKCLAVLKRYSQNGSENPRWIVKRGLEHNALHYRLAPRQETENGTSAANPTSPKTPETANHGSEN